MASTVYFLHFLCCVNSQNHFFVPLKSVVSIRKHFCVSITTTSVHCYVSKTLLCGVFCGVHIPVWCLLWCPYTCEELLKHILPLWKPGTEWQISLLLIFPASFWFFWCFQPPSDFLFSYWHSDIEYFFKIVFFCFLRGQQKLLLFLWRVFFLFLLKLISIFLTMLFAICTPMCTSSLVWSYTDSIPSIHIRLAILAGISWIKF